MSHEIYNKQYRAQQELRNCGLEPESIQAIQSTKVITKDGQQHVVPSSQAHLDETNKTSNQENNIPSNNKDIEILTQQLKEQKQFFNRYKQYTDQRVSKLEMQLSKALETLKNIQQVVTTLKSNSQAQQKREEVYDKQNNSSGKEPEKKAIDRNNVAPAEVQVDKIFYCGTR